MSQNEAMPLIETARGIHFQDRQPNPDLRRFCILDQAAQQTAADALPLVSRQQIKLFEDPKIRATLDFDQPDVVPGALDDFINLDIEIGNRPTRVPAR
jgi:hypothetical protein